jgi:carbon starvation protein
MQGGRVEPAQNPNASEQSKRHTHPQVRTLRGRERALSPFVWLTNRHGATILAVVLAAAIAALPGPGLNWSIETAGTGGLILWPLFGATNQLLGGLAFLVIAFWLWRRRLPIWFIAGPMLFMLVMPAAAMLIELPNWIRANNPNWIVISVAAATLALEAWMIVEALILWPKARGQLEAALPPIPPVAEGARSC